MIVHELEVISSSITITIDLLLGISLRLGCMRYPDELLSITVLGNLGTFRRFL